MAKIIDFGTHIKSKPATERQAFEQHWLAIGGAMDVPSRDDIDPGALGAALGSLLVIERIAPRQARIRLGGQNLTDILGTDLRGMPLSALFETGSHDWLGDLIAALFEMPARIEVGLAGPRTTFRARTSGDLLLLPLRDREGQITRAMAHVSLVGKLPSAPARLKITGESRRGLSARRRPPVPVDTSAFETADKARTVVRRREMLRLVPVD